MKRLTSIEFIKRAKEIHGDRYDYSQVIYVNNDTKIKIYCKKHNFWFRQIPQKHLNGQSSCNDCSQEKTIITCLNTYDKKYSLQSNYVKEKGKQTNLKLYGHEYASQSESFQQHVKSTNLKRYGVAHLLQSTFFYEKVIKTTIERYGVEHFNQKHIPQNVLKKLNNRQWLINQHHIEEKTLSKISQELNVDMSTISYNLKKHNIKIKRFAQSEGQKEVNQFIQSLGYFTLSNQRTIISPLEIDIFVPEENKAIEYNGLHWHKGLGKDYHINKTNLCSTQKIPLFHVWEDMWLNHRETTESMIINFLNNKPQIDLLEQIEIEIDVATDNPQVYIDLGYNIQEQTTPQLYSEDVWDCGKYILSTLNDKYNEII